MTEDQSLTTEAPQPNTPEARTETGEIKDQSQIEPEVKAPEGEGTSGPPEKYEFKGEGLDPKLLEEASPIFKELGLDQAAAQKLVDFYSKSAGANQKSLEAKVTEMRTDWRDQVSKDPVIGSKIKEAQVEIGRAKDLLPPEVRSSFNEAMDVTGAGDHPAVFRAMYEFAKLVNEGHHVAGGKPSPEGQSPSGKVAPLSAAKSMYPDLP